MTVATRIRTREDPVVRRAQIVDEAIRIVGDRGYNGFTVQALAERCGLSNAGLLYYFGSKDRLLVAVLEAIEIREEEYLLPLIESARDGAGYKSGTQFSLLMAMVTRWVEQPEVARFTLVLQLEALDETHPAHIWFAELERQALEFLALLVDELTSDPHATARQLYALMNGIGHQWIRSKMSFDLLAEWEKAIRALLPSINDREVDAVLGRVK